MILSARTQVSTTGTLESPPLIARQDKMMALAQIRAFAPTGKE
jgi:hypothetical protein